MLPMALECVKREFPDDWGPNDELCLTAAVQYARWADTAGAVEVRVPEDIDAQARSSAAFSESMLKVRCSTSSSRCEQLCCPMRTPSLRFLTCRVCTVHGYASDCCLRSANTTPQYGIAHACQPLLAPLHPPIRAQVRAAANDWGEKISDKVSARSAAAAKKGVHEARREGTKSYTVQSARAQLEESEYKLNHDGWPLPLVDDLYALAFRAGFKIHTSRWVSSTIVGAVGVTRCETV